MLFACPVEHWQQMDLGGLRTNVRLGGVMPKGFVNIQETCSFVSRRLSRVNWW